MEMLSTALSLFCALAGAWCLWRCTSLAEQCEVGVRRVRAMAARLLALESGLETLTAQHVRLRGAFYAERRFRPSQEREELEREDRDVVDGGETVCMNYAVAQQDGPNSDAAHCECGYCSQRRMAKRELRNASVPKTANGQATAVEENARR